MKKHLFSFLILLSSGISFGQSAGSPADLSKRKFQWMVNRRLDSLGAILDDRLRYIHSNGWTENKAEVLDDIKSGKIVYQSIAVEEMDVREYKSTAVVTGKGMFTGTNSGNSFNIHLMFTEVYIESGKGWLLVSRHANKLP